MPVVIILKVLTALFVGFGIYQMVLAQKIKIIYPTDENGEEEKQEAVGHSSKLELSVGLTETTNYVTYLSRYLCHIEKGKDISVTIKEQLKIYQEFIIASAQSATDNDPDSLQTLLIDRDPELGLKIIQLKRPTLFFLICFIHTEKIEIYKVVKHQGIGTPEDLSDEEKDDFEFLVRIDLAREWKFRPADLKLRNIPKAYLAD